VPRVGCHNSNRIRMSYDGGHLVPKALGVCLGKPHTIILFSIFFDDSLSTAYVYINRFYRAYLCNLLEYETCSFFSVESVWWPTFGGTLALTDSIALDFVRAVVRRRATDNILFEVLPLKGASTSIQSTT